MRNNTIASYTVLIIDTIGLLTKIYSYANIAYVGGGAGNTGLHNTLEPAVFGVPVLIGNNYKTFKEARELADLGGILPVPNKLVFKETLDVLVKNEVYRHKTGSINKSYTQKNTGATSIVCNFIRTLKLE